MTTPRPRRKRILALCGKILFSLLVLGGLLEVALRIVPKAIPTKVLMRFEPDLRARIAKGRFPTRDQYVDVERDDGGPVLRILKPFAKRVLDFDDHGAVLEVTADEKGFGNPPGTYDATPTIDIVAIGDSFTWCHAVDPKDGWAIRLGVHTGRASYNLGMSGMGLYEYLQLLKRFGLPKSPEFVVMNVYEGNDIRDAVHYHESQGGKTDLVAQEGWQKTFLARHSYAFNLVCGATSYFLKRRELKSDEDDVDFTFRVGSIPFNHQQGARCEVVYARWVKEGKVGFDVFDDALEAFVKLAKEHDFVPILAYSPSAHIVYEPVVFTDPSLADFLPWFSREQRSYFAGKAKELGYTFVDLTPALRAAVQPIGPTTLLYYPTIIHYTARGHEVVAEKLADVVRSLR